MKGRIADTLLPYWQRLERRERLIVAWGGAVLFVLLFYGLIWAPVRADLEKLRVKVPQAREQLAWMRGQVERARQLRASEPQRAQAGNMLTLIEQSAQTHGLRDHLKRVEPEGDRAVRLALDGVSFNALVSWLAHLNKQGAIRVENASMEAQAATGVVNARLLLRAAGS